MRRDLVNEQWEFQLKNKIWADEHPPEGEKYYFFSDWYYNKDFWVLILYYTQFSSLIIFLPYTSLCSISLHHGSLITDSVIPLLFTLPFLDFSFLHWDFIQYSVRVFHFSANNLILRVFLQKCHHLQKYNFIFSELSKCADILTLNTECSPSRVTL